MRLLLALLLVSVPLAAQRSPQVPVGQSAPGFTVADHRGQTRTLASYRGKYVVLEWPEKGVRT